VRSLGAACEAGVTCPSLGRSGLSARSKSQCRPQFVHGNLAHRPDAAGQEEVGQGIPIQVGAELTGFRVRDPGRPVVRRRAEDPLAVVLQPSAVDDEDEEGSLVLTETMLESCLGGPKPQLRLVRS
jgi:hypothetical protein